MKRRALVACVAALQVAYIGATVLYHQRRIQAGTVVRLQTAPVDPVSIFRGRYVALSYDISSLAPALLREAPPAAIRPGEVVYVVLMPGTRTWHASAIEKQRPTAGVFLRGKVLNQWGDTLRVDYGIETFFLSERSADALEQKRREFMRQRGTRQSHDAVLASLSEEDRRVVSALGEHWVQRLEGELTRWVAERLVPQPAADELRSRYLGAIERYNAARHPSGSSEPPKAPLIVEVSVTHDGVGYPVGLFWDGEAYR